MCNNLAPGSEALIIPNQTRRVSTILNKGRKAKINVSEGKQVAIFTIAAREIFHKGFGTLQFPPCAECAVCPGAPAAEDLMDREPGLFRVSLMSNQDISAISGVSVSGSS